MKLAGYGVTIANGGDIATIYNLVSTFFALFSTFYDRALYVIF